MTYRVYLRWPEQKVSDKTVTKSRELADLAYELLVARQDLAAKPVVLAFTHSRSGTKPEQNAFHNVETATAPPITLKKR